MLHKVLHQANLQRPDAFCSGKYYFDNAHARIRAREHIEHILLLNYEM